MPRRLNFTHEELLEMLKHPGARVPSSTRFCRWMQERFGVVIFPDDVITRWDAGDRPRVEAA